MRRKLVELVREETGADLPHIMLLRNAKWRADGVRAWGASMVEWISIKRRDSKYDYWRDGKPRIAVVVVIVRKDGCDRVYGAYRVLGIEADGTLGSLSTERLRRSYIECGLADDPGRKFKIEQIPFSAMHRPITGWEGKERSAVARSDGKLFLEIEVDLPE